MKIILSGGGTGGHILPNIALIQTLKKRIHHLEILYIGSKRGMESEMIPQIGIDFKGISCGKLRRYFSWENFLDPFKTIIGIWQSFWIIKKFKPAIIFCKGGYVTFPVVVAGWINQIPILTHESDLVSGMANKLNAPFSKLVLTSFKKTVKDFKSGKALYTGSMVREELADGNKARALEITNLNVHKPILLIMGGSQGANFINQLIRNNLSEILRYFEVIHLCGIGKLSDNLKKNGYFQQEFANEELKDFYQAADLVLSRAGANTLFELAFLDIPAILIPLNKGSRGDQIGNAEEFAKNHPTLIFTEKEISDMQTKIWAERSIKLLSRTLLSNEGESQKKQTANERICELIVQYAKKT